MKNVRVNHFLLWMTMLAAIAAFVLMPSAALAETYAHGYLRYEVADGSVTITGYAGHEETVTVPAMIGGNPVNSVAPGAFLNAQSVVAVYLPDTVTSVEQGAFGVGQAVVFGGHPASSGAADGTGAADGGSAGSAEDGSAAVDTGSGGSAEDGANAAEGGSAGGAEDGGPAGSTEDGSETEGGNAPTASAPGIRLDDGSLVSVDSEGHLVLVDSSGTERVLDDTRVYSRVSRPDGTISIVDDGGSEVVVADGSKVSFSDADGRQVAVDAARGSITTTSEDGTYSDEEANVDKEVEADDEPEAKSERGQEHAGNTAIVVAVAVAVVLAVAGVVFWRRRSTSAGA